MRDSGTVPEVLHEVAYWGARCMVWQSHTESEAGRHVRSAAEKTAKAGTRSSGAVCCEAAQPIPHRQIANVVPELIVLGRILSTPRRLPERAYKVETPSVKVGRLHSHAGPCAVQEYPTA